MVSVIRAATQAHSQVTTADLEISTYLKIQPVAHVLKVTSATLAVVHIF